MVRLAQVYQVISTIATLDNVVEFYFRNQLPSLPGLPAAEPIVATARLRHSLEIQSGSTVRITFESTELKTTGGACTRSLPLTCSHCVSTSAAPSHPTRSAWEANKPHTSASQIDLQPWWWYLHHLSALQQTITGQGRDDCAQHLI